jgi:adenylate kinase family enzyme
MHLVFVFGPPAAGKMTVGREICARTGYKLLHNHMTVEPVLDAEGEEARTELADFMAELEKQALRFEDKRDALKARMAARST